MKKLVALLCTLVLCLSVFNVAFACGRYPEDYIASPTGNDMYRTIGEEGHQWFVEFAEVCTRCGSLHGFTYEDKGLPKPHVSDGQRYNYHSGRQHFFYSSCTKCYGHFNTKSGLCPGSDTTPHITEASAHSVAVCLE